MLLASYLVDLEVRRKLIMSTLIWNGRLIKFMIQTVRDSIFRKILLYKQMALSYVDPSEYPRFSLLCHYIQLFEKLKR